MDTASHIMLGVTLGGLATIDPSVNGDHVAAAVMLGTILASNAPDFDTVFRLKGMNSYIRHHRGITHSLPALLIWPMMITLLLVPIFDIHTHWVSLLLWSFLGVGLHVFLDMLNTYGVQSLRPLNKRWVHLDILAIFEPFLFAIHGAGLLLWFGFGYTPGPIFLWIYTITFAYIVIRFIQHRLLLKKVQQYIGVDGIYHVIPTLHWLKWSFVMETDECFYTGTIRSGLVNVQDTYAKDEKNEIIQATMGMDGVRAFLSFAQRIHVCSTVQSNGDGYEVHWSDVRFWYKSNLAFGVDIQFDRNMNVIGQRLGWRKKKWDPPYM